MAAALSWTADRGRYGYAVAAIFVLWVVSLIVLGALDRPPGIINSMLAPAVLWNLTSFRRIADQRRWYLHAAPYVTWAGLTLVFWGLAASKDLLHPPAPPWKVAVQYSGLALIPAWLGATAWIGASEPARP